MPTSKAGQVRTLIKQDFDKIFSQYDLIIGPASPTVAFGIGENINDPITMYLNDILTIPVNLAGLPGMSIPAVFLKDCQSACRSLGNILMKQPCIKRLMPLNKQLISTRKTSDFRRDKA